MSFSKLPSQIQLFKNKILFRELLKDAFPNYFFKGVQLTELSKIETATLKFPLILKPAVGFFSLAVHKIDNAAEWQTVLANIEQEIASFKGMYPKEVVDVSDFIIEQYIEGEEYAVDCYFNKNGDPVVLNVMHHIFSSDKDVSDRVYSTSKEIIEKHKSKIEAFLKIVGEKAQLKNFPMHVEIRVDSNNTIIPIEINPLRFGGWCTTGDMSYFAYGFNSYEQFLYQKTPNWDTERIAEVDFILMKMALIEFVYFPSIPTRVTINEYIEIAKDYSTSKSSFFINGVLDKLLKEYSSSDRIQKIGRGLL